MTLPFAPNRFRAYEIEFGAGGQRLGCKFMLDDGTFLFVSESEITPEIESLMASLGSPAVGLRDGGPKSSTRNGSASTLKIAANLESHTDGE